jgi:arylsulfatase A-like enzyme
MSRIPRSVAVILGLILSIATTSTAAPERRPNILFILGDNLGRDWFGCYGSDEKATPEIDKLAATGLRFEHCYTTPLCSTTRAELLTGRYGFRTGWHTHHDTGIYGGGGLDWDRETTIARVLKSAGYATAISGKWQINDFYEQPDAVERHGFDEHLLWTGALLGEGTADSRWKTWIKDDAGPHRFESRYWDPITFRNGKRAEFPRRFGPDVYVEFLVDFMKRHRDQPFFAYYAAPLTHIPTVPTPHSPQPNAPEREQFAGMVRYLDYQVGQLVAALERLGLRDNTIVIFMTDNGTPRRLSGSVQGKPAVGGMGTLSENGLDMPLVVNCPARVPQGRVSKRLVDGSDFLPTMVELAGAKLSEGLVIDGHSFATQITGQKDDASGRDWIFAQYSTTRVARDQRFKLYSTGKIYDVEADSLEKTDLAGSKDPAVTAARARLQAVLDQLPPNTDLPFRYRSSSAFQIEAARKKGVTPPTGIPR